MLTCSTKTFFLFLSLFTLTTMKAQDNNLPYYEIPTAPEDYSPGNVLTRVIDGLGYRYHWASEGLRSEDLEHEFYEEGRNCIETIQHIYDLSVTIRNVAEHQPNIRPYQKNEMEYEELRAQTLENLSIARELFLNASADEMESFSIVFQNGERKSEYPLWNLMNGQLADAIYHTGQLIIFRRASGNPLNSKVRVFTGTNAK